MLWLLLLMAGGAVAIVGLVVLVLLGKFFNLWLQAKATDIPISLMDMGFMWLRHVDPSQIVHCLIALSKAGVEANRSQLEAHVLSGGNLDAVTEALISAQKAALGVNFPQVAAIDLAGRDVAAAVRARVNPKVLVCPPEKKGTCDYISGVCQDGVRLGVRARVTVRTNLARLVGGAGEETIIARVGEGIVAAIGRCQSHKEVLQRPELISEHLLAHGLDSGTCFEILSVDIADVDVMDNVGARLQSAQAETDKKIAQAHAEIRRAAAVAVQMEMRARTVDMHAAVVAARANLPLASASAFRETNFGRRAAFPPTVNSRLRWSRRAG